MTFDAQIQSITQDYIVPKITDQVLQGNVLTIIFLANGKPWNGEQFKVPVKLTSHTQGGSFNDFGEFNINNENTRQVAAFDPRAYYQSVAIGGIAQSVNNISKTQVLNLVKVEMESIGQDMVNSIGSLFYLDGTGNGGLDFLGIRAGIDDGTGTATYGGLSRATYVNWKSTIQTSVGAFDFSKYRTLRNSSTRGNQKPNLSIANETVFGYVESDYQATVQAHYDVMQGYSKLTMNGIIPQTRAGLVGQAGFDIFYFGGTPLAKDDKSTAGYLWDINTNMYRWYGVKDLAEATPVNLKANNIDGNDYDQIPSSLGFGWTGFTKPANQWAMIGQMLLVGNLFTVAPNLNSFSSGISS